MKAVIQRVRSASVVINGGEERSIGPGLLILVGVSVGDTEEDVRLLAVNVPRFEFLRMKMAR